MMIGAGTANRILAMDSSFFVVQPEGVAPKEWGCINVPVLLL